MAKREERNPKRDELILIGGRNPVLEALNSDQEIAQIFIDNSLTGDFEKQVRKLANQKNIPLKRVPKSFFNKYSRIHHQSIIAEISPIKFVDLTSSIQNLRDRDQALILLLDKVKDVRNIGAIARSAKAFDVDVILLPIKNAAPINASAVTASAGALLNIDVARYGSQEELIDLLKSSNFQILAADVKGKKSIRSEELRSHLCLALGSEESGINRELLRAADEWIRIDHSKEVESLNVSVSAGILLHEIYELKKS